MIVGTIAIASDCCLTIMIMRLIAWYVNFTFIAILKVTFIFTAINLPIDMLLYMYYIAMTS